MYVCLLCIQNSEVSWGSRRHHRYQLPGMHFVVAIFLVVVRREACLYISGNNLRFLIDFNLFFSAVSYISKKQASKTKKATWRSTKELPVRPGEPCSLWKNEKKKENTLSNWSRRLQRFLTVYPKLSRLYKSCGISVSCFCPKSLAIKVCTTLSDQQGQWRGRCFCVPTT